MLNKNFGIAPPNMTPKTKKIIVYFNKNILFEGKQKVFRF